MTQAKSSAAERPFERHGGRLDEARRAYPHAPSPWIDLSTGINPVPWQADAGLRVDPAGLPTMASLRGLEAAAAHCFGVDPAAVVAVPGSEIALRLLPALGLPGPLTALSPAYGTHAAVADMTIGRDAAGSVRHGTLLIANPNNPDGAAWSPATLHALAARRDGALVVDEAFADATPELAVLPTWDGRSPLVVTRSFGKFFGLAGVRLGFVVADAAVVERLRHLLGDWPVSAQAIAWGTAAYADREWIDRTRGSLVASAARLDALLMRHGLRATGGCRLFRLVEHDDAGGIFDRLAQGGILTRPFADRRDWLRFGLPADDAAFARLDRALGGD